MENREYKRLPVTTKVTAQAISGKELSSCWGMNISGGGMVVTSPVAYEQGSVLELEIAPGNHPSFNRSFLPWRTSAQVVRVEQGQAAYEIAVEFIRQVA